MTGVSCWVQGQDWQMDCSNDGTRWEGIGQHSSMNWDVRTKQLPQRLQFKLVCGRCWWKRLNGAVESLASAGQPIHARYRLPARGRQGSWAIGCWGSRGGEDWSMRLG